MVLVKLIRKLQSALRYSELLFKLPFRIFKILFSAMVSGNLFKIRRNFGLLSYTIHYLNNNINATNRETFQFSSIYYNSFKNRSINLKNADREYQVGNWIGSNFELSQAEKMSLEMRSLINNRKNHPRIIGSEITSSIGHTAVALALRARYNALNIDSQFNYVILAGKIANRFYLKLWEKYFPVIDVDPVEASSIERTLWPFIESIQNFNIDNKSLNLYEAHNSTLLEWQNKSLPPLLTFPESISEKAYDYLSGFGLCEKDWFVALHVRSNRGDAEGYGRNADILTYSSAVEYINEAGGKVIRIGEKTNQSMRHISGLIDLTLTKARPDWLDIFILSQCKFLIGTTSGPLVVPHTFGVPVLATNAPDFARFAYYPNSLVIPKLAKDKVTQKILSLNEMLDSKSAYSDAWLDSYKGRELAWRDNTSDEILNGTKEMLFNVNTEVSVRQEALKQRLVALGSTGTTLISPSFIDKHSEILED